MVSTYTARCVNICLNWLEGSPKDLPLEDDWPEILDLDLKTTTALTVTEFIARSKLDPKLGVASKIRAERDKHEEKKSLPMEDGSSYQSEQK